MPLWLLAGASLSFGWMAGLGAGIFALILGVPLLLWLILRAISLEGIGVSLLGAGVVLALAALTDFVQEPSRSAALDFGLILIAGASLPLLGSLLMRRRGLRSHQ